MDFTSLQTPPAGLSEALSQAGAVDAALMTGLSRLPEALRQDLDALAGTLAHSPLGGLVADAVSRLKRSEFSASACLGLAAGRSALFGAAYDALREQVHGATSDEDDTHLLPTGDDAPLLGGVQQWLAELAVAGLQNLTEANLMPFASVQAQLQARASLCNQAVLLAGFCDELIAVLQQKQRAGLPARRWTDLWCASMLGAQGITSAPSFRTVSGRLHPCGVDVRAHRSFVVATLWGVLETNGQLQVVRWPFASWKVSVLGPDEVWRAFGSVAQPILQALAEGKALALEAAELSRAGDLTVHGEASLAGPSDPFALAADWAPVPALRATARHPVHLAEMVRIEACTIADGLVQIGTVALPLALDRLAGLQAEVEEKQLGATTGMIALLRWDEGWRLQPLALRGSGKLKAGLRLGQGIAGRLTKLKTETLSQLEERASRLLRA